LKHNLQLVELLEIPQLVEACARNGFHDEALELALFANSLERKYLIATEIRDQELPQSSPAEPQSKTKEPAAGSTGNQNGGSGGKNIVQSIVNDVHKTLSDLRCQLLQKLSEEAALPKLLTILSSLRKLDGILVDRKVSLESHRDHTNQQLHLQQGQGQGYHQIQSEILSKYVETSLQMTYLEARSVWIQRMITNVYQNSYHSELQNRILQNSLEINAENHSSPALVRSPSASSSATNHLGSYGKGIEILEIYRSSWFSVITQFNALFLNSSSPTTPSTSDPTSPVPSSSAASISSCPPITLLSHWIHDQLQHFTQDIHCILHEIDEIISFKLFYEQVLLFSIRMSEIGCDFKDLVIPIFEKNLQQRIDKIWSQGVNQFKQMIFTEKYLPLQTSAVAADLEDENHQVRTEEKEGGGMSRIFCWAG
jgi:hypothetical protein